MGLMIGCGRQGRLLVLLAFSALGAAGLGCRAVAAYDPAPQPKDAAASEGPRLDGARRDQHQGPVEASVAEAGTPSFACDKYPPGYLYAKPLQIDTTPVGKTLTDFPVLVDIDGDADLDAARPDGADLRFQLADGTPLAYELEAFVRGPSRRLIAWVGIPLLSPGGAGTRVCLYFGNANAPPPDANQTPWQEGVFHTVLHFASPLPKDSSLANTSVSPDPNPPGWRANGRIGAALALDGTAGLKQALRLADGAVKDHAPFTIALWMQPRTPNDDQWLGLVTKGRESNTEWYGLYAGPGHDGTHNDVNFGWTGYRPVVPGDGNLATSVALQAGQWRYLVATFDGTWQRVYVDGRLEGERTNTYVAINEGTLIGTDGHSGFYFDGLIDELRIARVERSAAWIAAQYASQSDPAGFVKVGALQCASGC